MRYFTGLLFTFLLIVISVAAQGPAPEPPPPGTAAEAVNRDPAREQLIYDQLAKMALRDTPRVTGQVWDLFRDREALTGEMNALIEQNIKAGM